MDNERLEEILNQINEDWDFIKGYIEEEKEIVADVKIAFFNKEVKEYLPSLNTAHNHYDEFLKGLSRIIDSWETYLAEGLSDKSKIILRNSLKQVIILYEKESSAKETISEMKRGLNLTPS